MLQDLVGPAMMLPPSTGHQIAQQGQHGPPELVNPLLQAMQVRHAFGGTYARLTFALSLTRRAPCQQLPEQE